MSFWRLKGQGQPNQCLWLLRPTVRLWLTPFRGTTVLQTWNGNFIAFLIFATVIFRKQRKIYQKTYSMILKHT